MHLRHQSEELILWADALCINQTDDEEKSWQVAMMGDVYRAADQVIVWLGPGISDSVLAVKMAENIGRLVEAYNAACARSEGATITLDSINVNNIGLEIPPHMAKRFLVWIATNRYDRLQALPVEAWFHMLNLDWWRRVWVVQEIALSRNAVFVWGHFRISRVHLALALSKLFIYRLKLEAEPNESVKKLNLNAKIEQLVHVDGRALLMCGLPEEVGSSCLLTLLTSVNSRRGTSMTSCFDDRDRVFALLGMAYDREALGLTPDYSKTCEQIYIETAASILQSGQTYILSLTRCDGMRKNLPSWVPDWSAPGVHTLQYLEIKGDGVGPAYKACGDSELAVRCDTIRGTISLRGVYIESIESIGDVLNSTYRKPANMAQQFNYCRSLYKYFTNGNTEDVNVIAKTIVADQLYATEWYRKADENLAIPYKQILSSASLESLTRIENTTLLDSCKRYLKTVGQISDRRRPFICGDGEVGIGPDSLLVGDLIYVICGVELPYVFRRGEDSKLRLVGEAYISGIMDAEIWQDEPYIEKFEVH